MRNKKQDSKELSQEISLPDYVLLKEKYKCYKCKYNIKNAEYRYRFPHKLKYIFSTCKGEPCKRTECKKRCWFFSDLFSLVTAGGIVVSFLLSFSHLHNLLLSLAYTIIVAVIMDIICCIIEYVVDKIFESIENLRRKKYDKKVANIEAVNKAKREAEERQNEKEKAIYKDINDAKSLFLSFSNEYKEKIKSSVNTKKYPELKEELYKKYKEFLENMESLLAHITLKNFEYSEVKTMFKFSLLQLRENIVVFLETIEKQKETEIQIKELTKLLYSFSIEFIRIQENLKNSEAENLIYKMRALREVVSHTEYKED